MVTARCVDMALERLFEDYTPDALPQQERDALAGMLSPLSPSVAQRLVRLGFQAFSDHAPTALRLKVLKVLRRIRNTQRRPVLAPQECRFNEAVMRLEAAGLTRRTFHGRRAAVCLSYDVDRLVGYNFLDTIVAELAEHGLEATFNLLTRWEYEPSREVVQALLDSGHEVGLHGARHDVALGYRPRAFRRRELRRALADLGIEMTSYRAPALCTSPGLMRDVADHGFRIDSSLPMSNMYYHSVESCFPYPLDESGGLWELPVTLQDSTCFLDLGQDEDEALSHFKAVIEGVRELGGVAVLNLHPYVVIENRAFHSNFLEYLAEIDEVRVASQRSLLDG